MATNMNGADDCWGWAQAWKRICEASRREFQAIYDRLGVRLVERGESAYNPLLRPLVEDLWRRASPRTPTAPRRGPASSLLAGVEEIWTCRVTSEMPRSCETECVEKCIAEACIDAHENCVSGLQDCFKRA